MLRGTFSSLAFAIVWLGMAVGARAYYVFTNFDGPPDFTNGTTIDAINNNGDVVGFSTGATGTNTNFIRDPNGMFTILTSVNAASTTSMANGINDSNEVVGVTTGAFSLTGSTLTLLPPPNPGNTTSSVAFGVNNAGTIVGQLIF